MQQIEEMAGDGRLFGFDIDTTPIVAKVIPMEQCRDQADDQAVGDMPGIGQPSGHQTENFGRSAMSRNLQAEKKAARMSASRSAPVCSARCNTRHQ